MSAAPKAPPKVSGELHERWDELAEAVIEAARKTSRGCDCEYDHRCGRCDAIVTLHAKIKAFDAFAAPMSPTQAEPTYTFVLEGGPW